MLKLFVSHSPWLESYSPPQIALLLNYRLLCPAFVQFRSLELGQNSLFVHLIPFSELPVLSTREVEFLLLPSSWNMHSARVKLVWLTDLATFGTRHHNSLATEISPLCDYIAALYWSNFIKPAAAKGKATHKKILNSRGTLSSKFNEQRR